MTFLLQNFTVEIVGAAKQYQQSNTAIFFRVFSVFRGKKNLNLRKNRPTGDRLEFTTAMSAANGLSAKSADKILLFFPFPQSGTSKARE